MADRPTLFHAMKSPEATAAEFPTYEESGRLVKETWLEEKKRRYRSVSAWNTLEIAREEATNNDQGDWIAEMDLNLAPEITLFGPEPRGHYDMQGDPRAMARSVVTVHDREPHV